MPWLFHVTVKFQNSLLLALWCGAMAFGHWCDPCLDSSAFVKVAVLWHSYMGVKSQNSLLLALWCGAMVIGHWCDTCRDSRAFVKMAVLSLSYISVKSQNSLLLVLWCGAMVFEYYSGVFFEPCGDMWRLAGGSAVQWCLAQIQCYFVKVITIKILTLLYRMPWLCHSCGTCFMPALHCGVMAFA